MNFGMIILSLSMETRQDYVIWIQIALLCVLKQDFYKDIAGDVERWFDTSNYDEKDGRPLSIGKNKKVIGLFKDELGGKIMAAFFALRAKAYAYKLDDDTEMKKAKGTKKCIVKREITFKNYADALFNDEVIIRSQQRFRNDHHRVCTEEVNKIELSGNGDKVTTFPYGTNVFKVCESEMLSKNKLIKHDEDKNTPKDKDKDKTTTKTKTKTEDKNRTTTKTITATKTKTEDKDNTISKTKTQTEDKDEDIDRGRNTLIQVFKHSKRARDKKGNWKKRRIVWVFWDDDHLSELCEKWIYYNNNYAYTRFEELRTRSGEVLFTREHKATISKDKHLHRY